MPECLQPLPEAMCRLQRRGYALLRACVLLMLLTLGALGHAAEIQLGKPQLEKNEENVQLTVEFRFELNPRLEEAVSKGVVLHFVSELEIQRPRWYWFDEDVIRRRQVQRLSYNALTRQYRVSLGTGLYQSYSSLAEAVRVLSRVRIPLPYERLSVERGDNETERLERLQPGGQYRAGFRVYLDNTQLPRPFQITALGSREWTLASEWLIWDFRVPPLEAPVESR